MAKPGPPSKIELHPEREKIVAAILAGKKLAEISRKWGLDDSAVQKFATQVRKNAATIVAADATPAPKLVIAPTASPLERAAAVSEWCRVRIEYESARPGVSIKELAAMTAQLTSAIRMQARLDGSLDVTEAQLLRSAPFARVRQALIQALTFEGALTSSAVLERLNAACAGIMGE